MVHAYQQVEHRAEVLFRYHCGERCRSSLKMEGDVSKKAMTVQLVGRQEVYDLALRLSLRIQEAGFVPEVVVAIARGGFVPARYICDFLDIDSLGALKVKHYDAGSEEREEARLEYALSLDIGDKKVLLVDDVNDTGDTLELAYEHLCSHKPTMVKTAVLHEKKNSSARADFSEQILQEWRWITYPWARVEDLSRFAGKLLPEAGSVEELLQLLRKKHDMNIEEEHLRILIQLGKIEI